MGEKKSSPPNILSDILSDTPEGVNSNIEELNKLIHCPVLAAAGRKGRKNASPPIGGKARKGKKAP